MTFKEWNAIHRFTFVSNVKRRLDTYGYNNASMTDALLNEVMDAIQRQYDHRTLLGAPLVFFNHLENNLVDRLPAFINGLTKFGFWQDYINPQKFGTINEYQNVDVSGANPLDESSVNTDVLGYSKQVTSNTTSNINWQEVIRNLSNTWYWRVGIYTKIVAELEHLFVGVTYHEF